MSAKAIDIQVLQIVKDEIDVLYNHIERVSASRQEVVRIPVHADLTSSDYGSILNSLASLITDSSRHLTGLQSKLRLLCSQTDLVDAMPESSPMKAEYSLLVSNTEILLLVSRSTSEVRTFEVALTHSPAPGLYRSD